MRVCFFRAPKEFEIDLATRFMRGVNEHGDDGLIRVTDGTPNVGADYDVAVMWGVKSRELFWAHRMEGVPVVMLDKGYVRGKYYRVAVSAHHPTRYLMDIKRPHDRWEKTGLTIKPWRQRGDHILVAGSSAKYHRFYKLGEPELYIRDLVARIREVTDRPIVYRPKPSYRDAVPVDGATFQKGSPRRIGDALDRAHAMVTHGSNACFEAVLSGIPVVVLGDAVAKHLSSTDIGGVVHPKLADKRLRRQWAANLAYCQWKPTEFESGEAWDVIRDQVERYG